MDEETKRFKMYKDTKMNALRNYGKYAIKVSVSKTLLSEYLNVIINDITERENSKNNGIYVLPDKFICYTESIVNNLHPNQFTKEDRINISVLIYLIQDAVITLNYSKTVIPIDSLRTYIINGTFPECLTKITGTTK